MSVNTFEVDDFYEIVRDLAESDPLYENAYGAVCCCLCSGTEHMEESEYSPQVNTIVTGWSDDDSVQWVFYHAENCPWVRARKLFRE